MPKIEILRPTDLTDAQIQTWRAIQLNTPTYHSPYYSPEYIQTLYTFLPQTEIAHISDGSQHAFFPYHRQPDGHAMPPGICISDYQGPVQPLDFFYDPISILKAAEIRSIHFNHLPYTLIHLHPYIECPHPDLSPRICLTQGIEPYIAHLKSTSSLIENIERKTRKIQREIGPLTFTFDNKDPNSLTRTLFLKSAQYKATQKEDIFAPHLPFTAIMRQLHATRTPTFQGVLSTLYIHDRLIAAHFGMIYHHTYHIWFPTYDPEFEKYSPGLILLHQILLAFPSQRLTILDFGKGHDSYKLRFMNDAVPLAHGYIEPTTPRKIRRRFSQVTRRILSPLKPYLQPLLNRNRPKK